MAVIEEILTLQTQAGYWEIWCYAIHHEGWVSRHSLVNDTVTVENMLSNQLAIAALGRWNCHNRRVGCLSLEWNLLTELNRADLHQ
jgi:hypothetical protein